MGEVQRCCLSNETLFSNTSLISSYKAYANSAMSFCILIDGFSSKTSHSRIHFKKPDLWAYKIISVSRYFIPFKVKLAYFFFGLVFVFLLKQ